MNVRPFSPWLPAGATLDFAAEIASTGDCSVQIGRAIFGGLSLLPSGRVQLTQSDSPRTVRLKVRVADSEALLFQTSAAGGVMEIRDPRIQDAAGRILHKYIAEQVKPMSKKIVESATGAAIARTTGAIEKPRIRRKSAG